MSPNAVDAHLADYRARVGDASDLQALLLADLGAIHELIPVLRHLVDTRQAGLGFLSVEAAKVQDDLIRKERRDRVRHAQDRVTTTGVVPAPGSINAFSLLADWTFLLVDIEQTITRHLLHVGICHIKTRPSSTQPSDTERLHVAEGLARVTTRRPLLERLHRDAADLHERIDRAIEGTQVKAMPDPCPWCGRHTLVADLTAGVITCGRDPDTGEHETCLCSDSYCACKTSPRRHRHTWHRDQPGHKSTSWHGLRHAINAAPRKDADR
ncbi:hypothetical protein [Nocardioides sp. LHG3406-4]|uniref:hypothetical protein n=1 Tax=Nocardioides sp. LHG3406-4 TaxID=2804575 RepID=UPI003CF96BA2